MQNPLGSIWLRLLDLRLQRSMDPDMVQLNPEEEPASIGWLKRKFGVAAVHAAAETRHLECPQKP